MRERLDVILVNRGLAASREKAKELVKAGGVYVNGRRAEKAGAFFEGENLSLEVRGDVFRYVSRGGLKLEKAVDVWRLELEGLVCMDIGASTGGFTDCMLQNGAARVYSVDVGRDQLARKLREDKRVVCMEETNFRYLTKADFPEEPDFAAVDVSFISLTKILPPVREILKCGGQAVCLIKPQFEAGREKVGKNGVVRDLRTHREVLERTVDFADGLGFSVLHLEYSPVRGPEGNIEYLLHLQKREGQKGSDRRLSQTAEWRERISEVAESSHTL